MIDSNSVKQMSLYLMGKKVRTRRPQRENEGPLETSLVTGSRSRERTLCLVFFSCMAGGYQKIRIIPGRPDMCVSIEVMEERFFGPTI